MPVNTTLQYYHPEALSNALKTARPAYIDGASGYGPTCPISIWYQGKDAVIPPADEAFIQAVFSAHDPVFLSADKHIIKADGTDTATVTVTAPKPGAAAVTLSVVYDNGTQADEPITLVNGVGTTTVTAIDPCTITLTVKNPMNRSTDTLVIVAV